MGSSLSLHRHHMGVGQGQNVGLRDFCHILTLLPPGASGFHKHMSSFFSVFMGNESERGKNKSQENRFAVHTICLSGAPIHSSGTQKKDTHSLIELVHHQ